MREVQFQTLGKMCTPHSDVKSLQTLGSSQYKLNATLLRASKNLQTLPGPPCLTYLTASRSA